LTAESPKSAYGYEPDIFFKAEFGYLLSIFPCLHSLIREKEYFSSELTRAYSSGEIAILK